MQNRQVSNRRLTTTANKEKQVEVATEITKTVLIYSLRTHIFNILSIIFYIYTQNN